MAASTLYNGAAIALIVVPAGLVHLYRQRSRGMLYLLIYAALFAIGPSAVLLMALAMPAAWQSRPRARLLERNSLLLIVGLILFMLLAYALVALRTVRPGHSEQLLILILPFIALLASIGSGWLVDSLPFSSAALTPAVIFVAILPPLMLSIPAVRMFSQPDTRQIMLDWIHAHIRPGARFFVNGSYNVALDAAIYPSYQHLDGYAEELPTGDDYDYMILSDVRAYDIFRAEWIVPRHVIEEQRAYLALIDERYTELARINRPTWFGSQAVMNMAAYYHNPGLTLYCLNPRSCEAGR